MGQFSWLAQNTGDAILEAGARKHFGINQVVVMIDNSGNEWVEKNYQGYGEFGGKDFFVLVAEMNKVKFVDFDQMREAGIDLYYENKDAITPNLYLGQKDDYEWVNERPQDDPNQGWGTELCDDEDEDEEVDEEYED